MYIAVERNCAKRWSKNIQSPYCHYTDNICSIYNTAIVYKATMLTKIKMNMHYHTWTF